MFFTISTHWDVHICLMNNDDDDAACCCFMGDTQEDSRLRVATDVIVV